MNSNEIQTEDRFKNINTNIIIIGTILFTYRMYYNDTPCLVIISKNVKK